MRRLVVVYRTCCCTLGAWNFPENHRKMFTFSIRSWKQTNFLLNIGFFFNLLKICIYLQLWKQTMENLEDISNEFSKNYKFRNNKSKNIAIASIFNFTNLSPTLSSFESKKQILNHSSERRISSKMLLSHLHSFRKEPFVWRTSICQYTIALQKKSPHLLSSIWHYRNSPERTFQTGSYFSHLEGHQSKF